MAFGIDIAEALAAAHREGVLHRDLKPDNVFVDNFGRGHVLDWGSMKFCGTRHSRVFTPSCVGGADRPHLAARLGWLPNVGDCSRAKLSFATHRPHNAVTPTTDRGSKLEAAPRCGAARPCPRFTNSKLA